MAKTASITISNVAESTRQKPLISIDGATYDHAELQAALQTAKDVLPTDTWSRTVNAASDDAAATAAPADPNVGTGLKTPQ